MMLDAECRDVISNTAGRADATSTAAEQKRMSLARCEAMLKVLTRDDTLRRIYVRRRWQGLDQ